MILPMLKTFGRSLWHFFVRPAPTSVALMVGPMPDAANDDHAQLLRRAMRAASQPEEMAAAFETTVAEPKLSVVPPALPEVAESAPELTAEAAANAGEAESFEQAEEFEDDPEGGINEEADDAAFASTRDEEPAADAEEMDSAETAAQFEEAPEPVESLTATSDGKADGDGAHDEPAGLDPALAADDAEALAFEDPHSSDKSEEEGEVAVADEETQSFAIEADARDDLVVEEPVEIAKKVAQAPYVAALAELVETVSGLQAASAAADNGVSKDETAPEDAPQEDELSQEALAAADDADEGLVEPIAAALTDDPSEVEELAESESPAPIEASEEPIEEAPIEEAPAKKARKKRASSSAKKKSSTKSGSRKSKAKAKDEAPAEPVPEDDVWVSDAVVWSLSGEWIDGEWHAPEDLDCPQRLEELRELAAEGKLTIWGRSDDAAVWQPIEAAYWKSGVVEPASLAEGRENVVAEPATTGKAKRKSARKYSALKVSKSQIEEIWHPSAMH